MQTKLNIASEKNYLLIPEMPTPNGRMHLGHIAGPYLKMDMLRRKVQRGEGKAYVFSGSDVYESYVELKASQLHISTEEVCNHFHELIIKDFTALNIHLDAFINPLDKQWNRRFYTREKELMQILTDAGVVVEREEKFPYDTKTGKFLNGCWIKGNCPSCNSPTGSYLCEICGTHYRPMDIFRPENYPDAELINGKALYLKLNAEELLEKVNAMGITQAFKSILEKYLELQGPYIRLTTPQATGVTWEWGKKEKQVLFTYSGLLFFSVFCGDICQETYKTSTHPFAEGSDFITIASFGIDNAIPYLAGVLYGGMKLSGYKSFDYYFSNFFYQLNGEKFSTSRLHVIWAGDIVNMANVQPDAVRYYLTKQNPEFELKNFDVEDFVDTINKDLYMNYNIVLVQTISLLEKGIRYAVNEEMIFLLEQLITEQNKTIEPLEFNFSALLDTVNKWVELNKGWTPEEREKNCYWWLKGFAFIAYPVMPELSLSIWESVCGNSEITSSRFLEKDELVKNILSSALFRKISRTDMNKCIPQKLVKQAVTL
jgi:methionyl-tRNA synthetase